MIMNMLTGAHATLIPHITALHDCEISDSPESSGPIALKMIKLFEYEAENWVKAMVNDIITDYFRKLPEVLAEAVAADIADHPALPLNICLYLMDRSEALAEIMLEHAEILSDQDILYRLSMAQSHEALAIARRADISEQTVEMLVKGGEPAVYVTLLRNPSVQSRPEIMEGAIEMARKSPTAAWYVVNHPGANTQIRAAEVAGCA